MRSKIAISAVAYVVAAAAAYAAVGSIISSFCVVRETPPLLDCVYRDGSYVYVILGYSRERYNVLCRYTASGSLLRSVRIQGFYGFSDADRCHLGGPYFAVISVGRLCFMNKNTGSVARYFSVRGMSGTGPFSVAWDGRYYYIASAASRGEFTRYTASGAFAGNWVAAGWPGNMSETGGTAFAHRVKGEGGNYLVATNWADNQPSCVINVDNGSLVATWNLPPRYYTGAVYGDSSKPATYGAALWVSRLYFGSRWVCEVDLGARGGQPVVPASVGKIKAIYR